MMNIRGLYLITDDRRGDELIATVTAAMRGPVSVLQYRPKGIPDDEARSTALRLRDLCRSKGIPFIINDSVELAKKVEADGVHLGQGDGSIRGARALLGESAIIGRSTRTPEMARIAESEGADYIGFGSVYPTGTKSDAVHVGLDALRAVRTATSLPIVAIGGIDVNGAAAAIDAGADALAVISAVMQDPQPHFAAAEIALQFNRILPLPRGRVLTIAGSDSGGGAGIQADIKTICLLGGYAASAITALTIQNTLGVHGVHAPPVEVVAGQIDAVLDDIGADVIKTGMLHSSELVRLVADRLEQRALPAVIDPVMIAKGGSPLLQEEAICTVREVLVPNAYLLTPNVPEAEALTGMKITSEPQMVEAAEILRGFGCRNVLMKGGHLTASGEEVIDLLVTPGGIHRFAAARINTSNTHGTGCSTAAAIAALLAGGTPLVAAVDQAKQFVFRAIANATPLGAGHGPVNHYLGIERDSPPNL